MQAPRPVYRCDRLRQPNSFHRNLGEAPRGSFESQESDQRDGENGGDPNVDVRIIHLKLADPHP
jgi:hypothetical protein